ncbi:MAG: L-seryl-tRNA(Ser) seleniumtransferase [Planctomycetota bacterium]
MAKKPVSPLASLPAVGQLIEIIRRSNGPLAQAENKLIGHLSRITLDRIRLALKQELRQGLEVNIPSEEEIIGKISLAFEAWRRSSTCRVVNGSGIILHSGLGRALYPAEARQQLTDAASYVLLEVNKETGGRRRRDQFCADLVCELTGAEDATVVNNNAAATLIILNEMGLDKEIVVSRSQMIEIGGSYRLPDVFEAAGCRLKEVGTTNKSRISDYEKAVNENTGALMLVHTSNYRIVGFTEHVDLPEMVALGKKLDLPVIHDLGSGSLIDMTKYGVHDEPDIQFSVKNDADVICFSGDKLIGGPQAGIIIGKKKWIDRIRKNPLARALRIDKAACLALEATLKLYFEPESLDEKIPTLRMLSEKPESVQKRAEELASILRGVSAQGPSCKVVESTSELGAGTLPTRGLPTFCIAIEWPDKSAQEVADQLRMMPISIFSRIKDDTVHLDLRTMTRDDYDVVAGAIKEISGD